MCTRHRQFFAGMRIGLLQRPSPPSVSYSSLLSSFLGTNGRSADFAAPLTTSTTASPSLTCKAPASRSTSTASTASPFASAPASNSASNFSPKIISSRVRTLLGSAASGVRGMLGNARTPTTIAAEDYYWNYHGQRIPHLRVVHDQLRASGCKSIVWLAGDSSLDNKHWLFEGEKSDPAVMLRDEVAAPAVNGYQHILKPPRMARDVCYWLNHELEKQREASPQPAPPVVAINAAVEESILGERVDGPDAGLLPQDVFIQENVTEDDIIVIDVGGNDVALRPTMSTALNMAALVYLSCTPIIRYLSFAVAPRDGWYVGFPLGMGYFVNMFKNKLGNYIKKLVEKKKPKKVVVCMLYYLDQQPTGGWADGVLRTLGYDSNPAKLQAIIKRVFELGTSQIQVEGVEVVPFPLFKVLDGTDTTDYIERVEPSSKGGQKMAEALVPEILRDSTK